MPYPLFQEALNIMHKIDVLRGYCQSKSPESPEADMIAELLEEILDSQKQLIKNIDTYSTTVENFILFVR